MSFSAFLHNPYGSDYLCEKEKKAVCEFTNRENYDIDEELRQLVLKYFGNLIHLHGMGLRHHFLLMEKEVREKNLYGLIIYGADGERDTVHINDYTTENSNNVIITVQSTCYYLLSDYIKRENLKDLL